MRPSLSLCGCVVLAAVFGGLVQPALLRSQVPVKRVLIIHGGPEQFPGNFSFDETIRKTLFSHRTISVEAHSEYLENEEFGATASDALSEVIRVKYRDRPLDLVIANTTPTLEFVL